MDKLKELEQLIQQLQDYINKSLVPAYNARGEKIEQLEEQLTKNNWKKIGAQTEPDPEVFKQVIEENKQLREACQATVDWLEYIPKYEAAPNGDATYAAFEELQRLADKRDRLNRVVLKK